MTGANFYIYILNIFKRTDKSTEVYEAITDVITDMRLRLLSEDFKEETYSTSISALGEYRLSLPSDFGHIIGGISIVDVDDSSTYPPLVKISKEHYDELYHDRILSDAGDVSTDRPRHFCIYAEQVYLGPVPDKTTYKYQINYTTEDSTDITSDTTSVPFTDKWRYYVRSGVLNQLFKGLEQFEEASIWEAEYERGLAKIAENDDFNTSAFQQIQYQGL